MDALPRIIRFNDTAKYLGVSRATLWRWRNRHDFPYPIKLSSNVVGFDRNDIDAFIEKLKLAGNRIDNVGSTEVA